MDGSSEPMLSAKSNNAGRSSTLPEDQAVVNSTK